MAKVQYTFAKQPIKQAASASILSTPISQILSEASDTANKARSTKRAKQADIAEPIQSKLKDVKTAAERDAVRKQDAKDVKKALHAEAIEAPAERPIITALIAAGFKEARVAVSGSITHHGYTHADGRAVLFSYNGKPDTEQWKLQMPNGAGMNGSSLSDLRAALAVPVEKSKKPQAAAPVQEERAVPAGHVVAAPVQEERAVPAGHVVAAIKLLKGNYTLNDLHHDDAYGKRMALLKKLRNTDKVLAKTNTFAKLRDEFYAAVSVEPFNAKKGGSKAFAVACDEILKAVKKRDAKAVKAEKERIAAILKQTAHERIVNDGKPVIEVKRKTERQRAKDKEALRLELAEKARIEREDPPPPIATPRAGAEPKLIASDIRLLEDPRNGIVLLQLEKANSQGAICVYNNGSRVAPGVISPETLKILRPVSGADVLQAANQLLAPVVNTVVVTPVAHRHLTAVLNCKELHPMATPAVASNKKFAAPVVKPAAKKALKQVDEPKATKKTAAAPAKKSAAKSEKSSTPRVAGGHSYVLVDKKALAEYRSPQVAWIAEQLEKAGKAGMTKAALTAAAIKAGSKFPTNQPHDRAIGFYLSKFKGAGILKFAA